MRFYLVLTECIQPVDRWRVNNIMNPSGSDYLNQPKSTSVWRILIYNTDS